MEINSKYRTQRWIIAICIVFILFFSAHIPSPMLRNILVGVPGAVALLLQLIVLRQTTETKYRWQGIVLLLLTIMAIVLILVRK